MERRLPRAAQVVVEILRGRGDLRGDQKKDATFRGSQFRTA
jgi:hypothetical protein